MDGKTINSKQMAAISKSKVDTNCQWQDLIGTSVFLLSSDSTNISGQDVFILSDGTSPTKPHRIFTSIDLAL